MGEERMQRPRLDLGFRQELSGASTGGAHGAACGAHGSGGG